MKYNILVTHSVDDLVEFNSEKEYTKEQLYEIVDALYYDKDSLDELNIRNICVTHSVSSGMSIEYETEEEEAENNGTL